MHLTFLLYHGTCKKEPGRNNANVYFNVLNLLGGLCLFLFGMSLMGQALERRAGSSLRPLLER